MSRFEVSVATRLDVSSGAAWEYLMSHDEWRLPYVQKVTALTDGSIGVGSRFENQLRGGGRTWTVINEMTRVDPPRQLTWRQVNKDGPTTTIEGNYLLEAVDGAVDFTLHGVSETNGFGSGPAWLNRWILSKKVYPRFLENLRQALDPQSPARPHAPSGMNRSSRKDA